MTELTHFDHEGRVKMVDVADKEVTSRQAVVRGRVSMGHRTFQMIQDRKIAKGDVLAVAQVAGIMAAKRTSDLIPMCHPLSLTSVGVKFFPRPDEATIDIEAEAKTDSRTGVEMEAFVAVATAAITIYDMCKAVDRGMAISDIHLVEKRGGKSGTYVNPRYGQKKERNAEGKDPGR
jgi:cyclic pyranopterin phosphate synthase